MRLLDRFLRWQAIRRQLRHVRYLRKARVVLNKPHHTCERGKPECAGRL